MPYDPFGRGPFEVSVEATAIPDDARQWTLPCEVWRPARATPSGVILYSHSSGGNRASARFLCEHLASHGYTVAAVDHSEQVITSLPEERSTRIAWLLANRVPDLRLLLDHVARTDDEVGLIGHSFGGWTVLATLEVEPRIASVVALAPAGSSRPRPGIIPGRLSFRWHHPTPILVVAGDRDASTPLDGVRELYARAPEPKRFVVLRDADHMHFVDDVAAAHEGMRALPAEGELAWLAEMRPITELRPPAEAQRLVRALALAHFDATIRDVADAKRFLDGIPSTV